jgi:DNA integrity scanning protein DisA with diadenylate cyclase activity/mannitol/fructose-specific phosphotransferase system IIA component (Ntr-type)
LEKLFDSLSPRRAIMLRGGTKRAVIGELVDAICADFPALDRSRVMSAVLQRENTISSWIAPGIALPHARLPEIGPSILAVGLSASGVSYGGADAAPVHLVFLIVGDSDEPDRHINLLASMVRTLRRPGVQARLMSAEDPKSLLEVLRQAEATRARPPQINKQRLTRMLLDHATAVAAEVQARAVLVHTDALDVMAQLPDVAARHPVILVTDSSAPASEGLSVPRMILPRFVGLSRAKQVEVSILFGVYQGILAGGDRIVSISGIGEGDYLDSLAVVDVDESLSPLLSDSFTADLAEIPHEILERALQIAVDLAHEGREGKPVGTTFVLGDYQHVAEHCQQMVMNPFRGYRDDEKSLMDPFLEETIKELAAIDGAFVIRSDGVVMAAGAFVRPGDHLVRLQAGLGSRHVAAAAVTLATKAIAIVVSESTGTVTVFRRGKPILVLDKLRR